LESLVKNTNKSRKSQDSFDKNRLLSKIKRFYFLNKSMKPFWESDWFEPDILWSHFPWELIEYNGNKVIIWDNISLTPGDHIEITNITEYEVLFSIYTPKSDTLLEYDKTEGRLRKEDFLQLIWEKWKSTDKTRSLFAWLVERVLHKSPKKAA
jgi:hypothetical protein